MFLNILLGGCTASPTQETKTVSDGNNIDWKITIYPINPYRITLFFDSLLKNQILPTRQDTSFGTGNMVVYTYPRGYKEYRCVPKPQKFYWERLNTQTLLYDTARISGDTAFLKDSVVNISHWRAEIDYPCLCTEGAVTYTKWMIQLCFPDATPVKLYNALFDTTITPKTGGTIELPALPLAHDFLVYMHYRDTVLTIHSDSLKDDWMQWDMLKRIQVKPKDRKE